MMKAVKLFVVFLVLASSSWGSSQHGGSENSTRHDGEKACPTKIYALKQAVSPGGQPYFGFAEVSNPDGKGVYYKGCAKPSHRPMRLPTGELVYPLRPNGNQRSWFRLGGDGTREAIEPGDAVEVSEMHELLDSKAPMRAVAVQNNPNNIFLVPTQAICFGKCGCGEPGPHNNHKHENNNAPDVKGLKALFASK